MKEVDVMNYLPQSVNPYLVSLLPNIEKRIFSRVFPSKSFNEEDFQKVHVFFSLPSLSSNSLTIEVVNSKKKTIDSSDVIRFYVSLPSLNESNKTLYTMFYREVKKVFQKNALSEEQKKELKDYRKTETYKKAVSTVKKLYNLQ